MRLVAVRLCPGHTYRDQVSYRIESFFIPASHHKQAALSKFKFKFKLNLNSQSTETHQMCCSLSQEAIKNELLGTLRQFAPRLAENGTPYPSAIVDDTFIPILAVATDMGADVKVGYSCYKFLVTCNSSLPLHP